MSVHDVGGRRRFEDSEFTLRIYPGVIAEGTIYCPVTARKITSAAEVIEQVIDRLQLDRTKCYVLAEVKEFGGEEWILNPTDCPVQRMMLWPRMALENRFSSEDYRFLLREKNLDGSIHYGNLQMWLQVTEERRRMVERGFLPQPLPKDFDDLCNLPDLNEKTLLDNLRSRFKQEKIYTYVGSILIVINPFKFLPIYNPKYVKMYDNHQLGKLEPHIYAVADVAYHAMLQSRQNQCIVISGESGSGKTQSTNFLIHHLTALSQKGFASGVEQIILGAGPVLEAFGNAKTAHNNNSSRFGKFIQVNYQESGTVRGAYVEKYLLEKSRLVYQEHNERNYHVFYYLLAGASEEERTLFHLKKPEEYHYLNQMTKKPLRLHWDNYYENEPQDCFTVEGEDLKHDFERLQLAMEMVGFLPATRKQIFSLLSAILHLGNIRYKKKIYRDDSIDIGNPEVLPVVSELLEVKEEMLFEALTTRKTVTVGEKLIVPYKLAEAGTVRDSMAKSLYSALFDWIVFRINHALLNQRDLEESAKILSIGVLDIFGFEDYENNSFEQFCINFANERLQHYFNQHIFKLEQEEYRSEGITWHNIDYIDNTGCINLISKKPTALLHLLDEECNFPQATNQTLLDKFKRQHEGNIYIEFPAVMEPAFIIKHYAGKVKYGVKDFREKNTDHMRPDIVALLKSSKSAFIGGLIGIDPVATFRWAVLRAYFRAMVAFRDAGKRHVEKRSGHDAAAPVVKSVDSFSFLHHPVHQRSLEILQRCKEEKYIQHACFSGSPPLSPHWSPCPEHSRPSTTSPAQSTHSFFLPSEDSGLTIGLLDGGVNRRNPRTPLSDLQGSNTLNQREGWNGRAGRQNRLSSAVSYNEEDGIFVNSTSSKLLERAHGILMRNKNYKMKPSLPKHLLDVKSLKYLSNLTLHDRITKSLLHLHKKKKPPSISAQFQASLNKLMETLGQSEPYFVKCIRSNAEKLPLRFNDALVLRQLRYTGMLETVRIRQSGYSTKYTFQDFVQHFHVLLPEGTNQAGKEAIRRYLHQVDLIPEGFQVGRTMYCICIYSLSLMSYFLPSDVNGVNLDDYNINVIASVFKQWLRDLPNPLMTFELYDEFLRAMGLQDKKEVIRGVYSIIDQLSRTHLNTLERLIFHLVRIALQEETNRMSANALAIVFAPCILRCPDTTDPLRSVQDIGKTTACVELIICEQMNKYKARLKDISTLEFAENKAKSRLTFIRRSMKPVIIAVRFMSITRSAAAGKGHNLHKVRYHTPSPPVSPRSPTAPEVMQESGDEEASSRDPEVSEQQQVAMQQEEKVLTEQIESLLKEKEELTFEMLALEPRASDDETLESEASIGTADSSENLNVDSEGATSDFSERGPALAALRPKKSEGKSRRVLRKQPESLDSMDSSSTISSVSSSYMQPPPRSHKLRLRPKSPSTRLYQSSPPDSLDQPEQDEEERPQYTSRGTFNPEKGKQRLQGSKNSPQRHPPMGGGPKRDPDLPPQQVVVYGSNEFMV
ncbi:unconventional myosin-IXAa [Garra rufa]|uniref:unconventional myosin-IXAa n=1 Tax=Garra rufa TaxID=137080 RepID=UPI003CCEADA0